MDKLTDWDKILRYLSGECTYDEELEMLEWIRSNPENEEFIHFLELIWQMEPNKKKNINADDAWARFSERFNIEDQTTKCVVKIEEASRRAKKSNNVNRKSNRLYWYRITALAASFLLVITISWFFSKGFSDSALVVEGGEIEYREIRTEKGQRSRIILYEGSVIHLNGDSYIRMPAIHRPGDNRVVYLEGEAFFEITNNNDIRFKVIAAESVTTVLGTRFSVRSYHEDPDVTVVVADGLVSFGYINEPAISPVILSKNQKGVIGRGFAPVIENVADLSIYHGWTEGELVFEQEELAYMISRLERWFGIDIEMLDEEGALQGRRLTASFSERQPVEDVLQSISLVLGLSIERMDTSGNTYKLINKQ